MLNLKQGDTLNVEYILATRELAEALQLDQLANKAITGSPDDVLKFRQHMALIRANKNFKRCSNRNCKSVTTV